MRRPRGCPRPRARLNYPLNYWNGLAALMAMGVPLVLVAGHQARSLLAQALSVAVLPAVVLAGFYTLSRGGAVELGVGLALLFVLYPRRLALLPPLLVAALGSGILMLAAAQRDALQDGLTGSAASGQGDEMLADRRWSSAPAPDCCRPRSRSPPAMGSAPGPRIDPAPGGDRRRWSPRRLWS